MKINIKEANNMIELITDSGDSLEKYEKDKPINFKILLDRLVDLKFEEKVIFNKVVSNDIQNQAIIDIISEILNKYNEKVDDFSQFKKNKHSIKL